MTVNVLGISAYYHDSAAALVRDGQVVAAAQEERFSRKKHDASFPRQAINYCLGEAFIEGPDLDAVVFYDNPLLTLDRVVKNAVARAPAGRDQFVAACRSLLGAKTRLMEELGSVLGIEPRLLVTPHHMSHAASCFYPSPFEQTAILTVDGVGEWGTCALGVGKGRQIELHREIRYPHSLGLLYSAFTYFCGFEVNSDEYKLMGLAPYGDPRFVRKIKDELIEILDDGSFRLNTDAFGFLDSPVITNRRFDALFGGPRRRSRQPITRRETDLSASVQQVTEEILLRLAKTATRMAGSRNLVVAGGVALNCVANGRILRDAEVDGLFVQPAAGDAGGALGAALLVSHQLFEVPRVTRRGRDGMRGGLLGPSFSTAEISAFFERQNAVSHRIEDPEQRANIVAAALAAGDVVGLFSGRMEFGPRALGSRSILADPRCPDMQERINRDIKFREDFRPFAPAVLAEHASEYFELDGDSPYMLLVVPVREERRLPTDRIELVGDPIYPRLRQPRSDIPAVTHVDYSARVQTVGDDANPEFRRILRAFHAKTGCPVLVNTSFNVRGEPIVCTPQDAFRCFMQSGLDLMVIEDRLLWKTEQGSDVSNEDRQEEYEPG